MDADLKGRFAMNNFCSSCGSSIPPDARFCPACGAVVVLAQSTVTPATATRQLFRPLYDRRIAGVCAAMSRAWGWDIGLLRVLTVICGIFLFPLTEIVYVACWIGIPEEMSAPPLP